MPRTFVLGLDGATFTLIDHLIDQGIMPNLGDLVSAGVRCELHSTPNPYTPPAWTSLATGMNPGNHGIFDFAHISYVDGKPQYTIANTHNLRAETVWSIASRLGRTVAVVNFPAAFPPLPVNGFVVPGFIPPKHLRRLVYPLDFYDEISALPAFDADKLLFDLDLERESIQTLPEARFDDWVRIHITRERQWIELTRLLLGKHPCDLMAVILDGGDKISHLCWRLLDPAIAPSELSDFERVVRNRCWEYYAVVDAAIGEFHSRLGEDGHFVICSDHGFTATSEVFYANVLLAQHGYLKWADGVMPDQEGRQMPEGHRNPSVLFDWSHTTACALTAGSNGIYIRKARGHGDAGVAPEDYVSFRAQLMDDLLAFRHPDAGVQVVTNVLTRDEAYPGRESEHAPDLTITLRDHGFLSILCADAVVKPRSRVMGTHHPQGIFVAKGPAFRQEAVVEPFSIIDVGAILLHCAGLPLPEDLDAELPHRIFDAAWLDEHPPITGDPTEIPDPFFSPELASVPPVVEDEVASRLRALGYLE